MKIKTIATDQIYETYFCEYLHTCNPNTASTFFYSWYIYLFVVVYSVWQRCMSIWFKMLIMNLRLNSILARYNRLTLIKIFASFFHFNQFAGKLYRFIIWFFACNTQLSSPTYLSLDLYSNEIYYCIIPFSFSPDSYLIEKSIICLLFSSMCLLIIIFLFNKITKVLRVN